MLFLTLLSQWPFAKRIMRSESHASVGQRLLSHSLCEVKINSDLGLNKKDFLCV